MNNTTLSEAIAAREAARAKYAKTSAAVEPARQLEAQKKALAQAAAAAVEAASVEDAARRAADQRDADEIAKAATRAVAAAQQAQATAAADLQAAERAVRDAADAVLSAEAEALAEKVNGLLEEAIRMGAQLRQYQPSGLHTPVHELRWRSSSPIQWVLDRLQAVSMDSIHTPVNMLRPDLNQAPSDFLAKRRAALIASATAETGERAA